MRTDRLLLEDILAAINQIEQYVRLGQSNFLKKQLIQDGIIYRIIVIGEAAGNLSFQRQVHSEEVDWGAIVGMRNILVHEYFRVDLDLVWLVVENHLPVLKTQIEKMLEELEQEGFGEL